MGQVVESITTSKVVETKFIAKTTCFGLFTGPSSGLNVSSRRTIQCVVYISHIIQRDLVDNIIFECCRSKQVL
jgi:hypothetical protein